MKKKLIGTFLTLCMVFALIPMSVFAQDPASSLLTEIRVNGVNIMTAPSNTVQCGGGTAVYNSGQNKLTLNNVTIDTMNDTDSRGIYADSVLNIVVNGENKFQDSGSNGTVGSGTSIGICVEGAVDISGSGTLTMLTGAYGILADSVNISAKTVNITTCNFSAVRALTGGITTSGTNMMLNSPGEALSAKSDIGISGGEIRTTATSLASAVYSEDGKLTVNDGADIVANGELGAVRVKGDIVIDGATVKAYEDNSSSGYPAMYAGGSLTISGESDVIANGYRYGIEAKGSIEISGGKVQAIGKDEAGIVTSKSLSISGTADVTAKGYYFGLRAQENITISGGKVEAFGTDDDAGIFAKKQISITGGIVHAKGADGYGAIGVMSPADVTEPQIILNGVVEKNGGYAAAAKKWTHFISKDDAVLKDDLSNALNEVWIAAPCTVTFDVNGGEGGNPSVKVFPNDKVAKPADPTRNGYTFAGWYNEDKAFDFANSEIKTDMTLTAKWKEPKSVLIDNSTGTTVEKEDGTAFDSEVVLQVTPKTQEEMKKLQSGVEKAAPGLTLAGLYDVKLLKNGVEIQPDGNIKVSIPLTENLKAMTELKVVYIDDNGNVTIIPSEIKNGKIVFVTDHFSYYGVIGKVADIPVTGDSANMVLWIGLFFISGSALTLFGFIKKRRG